MRPIHRCRTQNLATQVGDLLPSSACLFSFRILHNQTLLPSAQSEPQHTTSVHARNARRPCQNVLLIDWLNTFAPFLDVSACSHFKVKALPTMGKRFPLPSCCFCGTSSLIADIPAKIKLANLEGRLLPSFDLNFRSAVLRKRRSGLVFTDMDASAAGPRRYGPTTSLQ